MSTSRISLPRGPLYGRIVVEAESRLQIRPTQCLGTCWNMLEHEDWNTSKLTKLVGSPLSSFIILYPYFALNGIVWRFWWGDEPMIAVGSSGVSPTKSASSDSHDSKWVDQFRMFKVTLNLALKNFELTSLFGAGAWGTPSTSCGLVRASLSNWVARSIWSKLPGIRRLPRANDRIQSDFLSTFEVIHLIILNHWIPRGVFGTWSRIILNCRGLSKNMRFVGFVRLVWFFQGWCWFQVTCRKTCQAFFDEERRWLFQQQNPDWYVPDLKPQSNWTLQVKLHPVCYAPLKRAGTKPEPYIAHVHDAADCPCGNDRPGFGTACAKEEQVKLSNSSRCIFLRNVTHEVRIQENKSSLSTGLGMVLWLQDAYTSGKYAGLRLADKQGKKGPAGPQGPREWKFEPRKNSKLLGSVITAHLKRNI